MDLSRSRSPEKDVPRFETTIENATFVPSILQCFKNPLFRILFLSQIVRALGAEVQNTVLPYIVDYVIEPSTMATPVSPDTIFALLAGVGLLAETLSVPVWYAAARRFGRIRACVSRRRTRPVRLPFLPPLLRLARPASPHTATGTSPSYSLRAPSFCSRSSSHGTRLSPPSSSSPSTALRWAASGCSGHSYATSLSTTNSLLGSGARRNTMRFSTSSRSSSRSRRR